jgi:hypothetical protein
MCIIYKNINFVLYHHFCTTKVCDIINIRNHITFIYYKCSIIFVVNGKTSMILEQELRGMGCQFGGWLCSPSSFYLGLATHSSTVQQSGVILASVEVSLTDFMNWLHTENRNQKTENSLNKKAFTKSSTI